MATNWERSKSKKLHDLLGSEYPEEDERMLMMTAEMVADTSIAMATGNVTTWIQLTRLYDEDKSLSNQSVEFQRQAAVTAASTIGLGLMLHGTGFTSFEFAVGRHVALRPITKVTSNPLVVVPAVAIYQVMNMPEIAGPQYQSAMTGQPNIGGSALHKKSARSWSEFFSPGYWGLSRRG